LQEHCVDCCIYIILDCFCLIILSKINLCLFKARIFPYVFQIRPVHDQVWFRIHLMPNVIFCAVYIPPSDSIYYSPDSFAALHSEACQNDHKIVILGDLNARMPHLSQFDDSSLDIKYQANVDLGSNANGRCLRNLCGSCDLRPLNHMTFKDYSFYGDLTYKQGRAWTSQLDWALSPRTCLNTLQHLP
jgi:hypothetical protein